jgi:nitrogen-specific signal transduction histidine kinase
LLPEQQGTLDDKIDVVVEIQCQSDLTTQEDWRVLQELLERNWWQGKYPLLNLKEHPKFIPLDAISISLFCITPQNQHVDKWEAYRLSDYYFNRCALFFWIRKLGVIWRKKMKTEDLWFRLDKKSAWWSVHDRRAPPLRESSMGKLSPKLSTPKKLKYGSEGGVEVARLGSVWEGSDPQKILDNIMKEQVMNRLDEIVDTLPDAISVMESSNKKEILKNRLSHLKTWTGYQRDVPLGSKMIHYDYHLDYLKDYISKHVQSLKFGHLSQMGQMIVHELNNPIGGIYNLVQMMQLTLADEASQKDAVDLLQKIEKQCMRSKEIIEHLSSYFGATPSHKNAQLENFNLKAVFSEVQSLVKSALLGTTLSVEVSNDNIEIHTNRVKILHVLVNLIINASESIHGREGGQIQLRAFTEGKNTLIEVEDNGPGIPRPLIEKILEPFFSTKGKNSPNSGLGLSLVKFFLKELKYQMVIESSQSKRRTVFRIIIPKQSKLDS